MDEREMMERVCAWCGKSMGWAMGPAGTTTHGICLPCAEKVKVEAELAKAYIAITESQLERLLRVCNKWETINAEKSITVEEIEMKPGEMQTLVPEPPKYDLSGSDGPMGNDDGYTDGEHDEACGCASCRQDVIEAGRRLSEEER
jgi:hypothetical protein